MTINLITFASILHKQVTIRSSHEAVLSELEKYFTVKFVDYRDIHQLTKDDAEIIYCQLVDVPVIDKIGHAML